MEYHDNLYFSLQHCFRHRRNVSFDYVLFFSFFFFHYFFLLFFWMLDIQLVQWTWHIGSIILIIDETNWIRMEQWMKVISGKLFIDRHLNHSFGQSSNRASGYIYNWEKKAGPKHTILYSNIFPFRFSWRKKNWSTIQICVCPKYTCEKRYYIKRHINEYTIYTK